MKVSVVITVLNEEKTIGKLLEALASQTKKPDEIIIVDGGSLDHTVEKVEDFVKSYPALMIHIIRAKGANVARGRNLGVKEANGEIIVMTDAGCLPHKDWFGKITQPFKDPSVDVVAGFYLMTGESVFQKCLACYLGVLPERLDPKNFLPSARSIAFKKEIWEKVGGFSENLTKAGEDTLFNWQAKRLEAKFVTASDALVDWEMTRDFWEATKKFYNYAKGDAEALYWPHLKKNFLVFFRYLIGLFLIIFGVLYDVLIYHILAGTLIFVYFFWAVWKNYRYVRKHTAPFYLPLLQLTADLAVMSGTLRGIIRRF